MAGDFARNSCCDATTARTTYALPWNGKTMSLPLLSLFDAAAVDCHLPLIGNKLAAACSLSLAICCFCHQGLPQFLLQKLLQLHCNAVSKTPPQPPKYQQ